MALLLFPYQSLASSPPLSSMLSEESRQQFQELMPAVQAVIRDSMFPQVLKKIPSQSQRTALEAIVATTHEQQSDGVLAISGGYLYGTNLAMNSTLSWTGHLEQKDYLKATVEFQAPHWWTTTDDCSNCYSAIAWLAKPTSRGYYSVLGYHYGQFPIWGATSYDQGYE